MSIQWISNYPQMTLCVVAIGLAIVFNPWWLLLLVIHIND
jgi:hypothetical protein